MNSRNNRLRKLREQKNRKAHLEAVVEEQRRQREKLSEKVKLLNTALTLEQKDVDRLVGKTLAAMFYELIGKKEDKLTKEKKEAYAARLKYDAAARELEAVESSLRKNEAELQQLQGVPEEYEKELVLVLEEMRASDAPAADTVIRLQDRMGALDEQLKELQEAIAAGKEALKTANFVKMHLDSAEDYGTWDLFGGGLLSHIAKYDELDNAQLALTRLQKQLRTFKTELVDVTVETDVQVTIEGFTEFADWFFDGFFADLAVMERISGSIGQINRTRKQLQEVLARLEDLRIAAEKEWEQCRMQLEDLASA